MSNTATLSPTSLPTFDVKGLLPYQHEPSQSICMSLLQNNVAVDFSDLGTGKTFTAGGAIRQVVKHLKTRFFVICPRVVKKSWGEACEHFELKPFGIVNYEKICRGNTPYCKWKRVRDAFGKLTSEYDFVWKLPKDYLLVFDEVHKAKGHDTLNGQLLRAAKRQGYRIHCMSATAATNPLEMYSLGYTLGLHDGNYKNFKQWCNSHGCDFTGRFGAMSFDHKEAKAQEGMKAIHKEIFHVKKLGTRISIADLGDKFPDSLISADAVDMGDQTKAINRAYENMEAELAKLNAQCANYKDGIFAAIMKARRIVEMQKVPTLVDMAKDGLENGKSVVIFVNFTDTIDALANRLKKYDISKITGGQTDLSRNTDIEKFQRGITKICLVNIAAGGAGVSLHDTTGQNERLALIAPTYSAINMVQCMGRVRRQGGGFTRQQIVYADGTIENRICQKVRAKLVNINLLNDGDLCDNSLGF